MTVPPARLEPNEPSWRRQCRQIVMAASSASRRIARFASTGIPASADAVAKNKAKILICHGALDPSMKQEQIDAYLKAMNDSKIDYKFSEDAGALHAFSNPEADKKVELFPSMKGFIGYSPSADRRSWEDMQAFFSEIFAKG